MIHLSESQRETLRYFVEGGLGVTKLPYLGEQEHRDHLKNLDLILPALLGPSPYSWQVWNDISEVPDDCHFIRDRERRIWIRQYGQWTNSHYGACDLTPGEEAPFTPVEEVR
jgi:hypothetical protein